MSKIFRLKTLVVITLLVVAGSLASVANANHSWGKYHWNKSTDDTTTSPLLLGNNLDTPEWNSALGIASTDWNQSVLLNEVASGAGKSNCGPVSGQVEVCNSEYGDNGWLGIASIWITRGRSSHIVQGVVKLNDTYFNTDKYNTQAWKGYVTCQEVGHTFGLGHQDENLDNANLGSCMDYTNNPEGPLDNRHPNPHDFDMMTEIYAHLNSTDSGDGGGNGKGNNGKKPNKGADIDLNNPSEWGQVIGQDALGRDNEFERELPNGQFLVTHVLWAN